MDRVASRFSGKDTVVRGAPVVGYFLDHPNYARSSSTYPSWMQYIYHMQNLTAGALMPDCLAKYTGDEAYKCFMAPYAQARSNRRGGRGGRVGGGGANENEKKKIR